MKSVPFSFEQQIDVLVLGFEFITKTRQTDRRYVG